MQPPAKTPSVANVSLPFVEEAEAPLDGRSERRLAGRDVAHPARERCGVGSQPSGDLGRSEDLRPRRRQLQGEGEAVEPAAELGDVPVRSELAPGGAAAGEEELHGLALRDLRGLRVRRRQPQRLNPVLVLAGQGERHPAVASTRRRGAARRSAATTSMPSRSSFFDVVEH